MLDFRRDAITLLFSKIDKMRDREQDSVDGNEAGNASDVPCQRTSGASKKPKGRLAPINRNIRFAVVSAKPAKLQYNAAAL